MTDFKDLESITVPPVTETMLQRAVDAIQRNARTEQEFKEFLEMAGIDLWRCGYCGHHYVTPSLARSCEAKHERNNE